MMNAATRCKWTLAALFVGALAGCGVMTIDVDVYTGPLSNHEDVQREQAAVTALAAKPLLAKLRYQLERSSRYTAGFALSTQYLGDPDALPRLQSSEDFIEPVEYKPVPRKPYYFLKHLSQDLGLESDETLGQEITFEDRSARCLKQFYFVSSQAAFVNKILAEYSGEREVNETNALAQILDTQQIELAAGRKSKEQFAKELEGAIANLRNTTVDPAWRTARGRPGSGLGALTVMYMARKTQLDLKTPRGRVPEQRYFPEEGELYDALIHFAQKTLFCANNYVLFNEKIGLPQAIQGSSDIALHGGIGPFQARDSYVTVLQTVGNSILVNLDELREQEAYSQTLSDRTKSEEHALNSVVTRNPYRVIQDLIQSLEAQEADLEQMGQGAPPPKPTTAAPAKAASLGSDAPPTVPVALAILTTDGKPITTVATTKPTTAPAAADLRVMALATPAKASPRQAAINAGPTSPPAPAETTPDKQRRLKDAIAAITEVAADLLKDALANPPRTPTVLLDRLRAAVQAKLAAATDDAKKASYQNALTVLSTVSDPIAATTTTPGAKTTKDVIDSVIAELRYEQIEAVREGGSDSEAAKRVAEALDIAYAQRAGMAYIRPASSYLKTSSPATSLQRDARLGFHNLLLEHMSHQIPFSEVLANGDAYRTILELDKQYWHNINTVRVAGGGDTNYVVAKDDIGNWYVKNYSADPKDIIKSAQGLALFALGPAIGAPDLVSKALNQDTSAKVAAGNPNAQNQVANNAQSSASKTNIQTQASVNPGSGSKTSQSQTQSPISTDAQSASVINKEFTSAKNTYQQQTTSQLSAVTAAAAGIKSSLTNAWHDDPKLNNEYGGLLKLLNKDGSTLTLNDKPPANETDGDKICDLLDSMRLFRNNLQTDINNDSKTFVSDTDGSDRKAALEDLRRVVSAGMSQTLTPRLQTVQQYQNALDLISSAQSQ
jgi:hypothetical protein